MKTLILESQIQPEWNSHTIQRSTVILCVSDVEWILIVQNFKEFELILPRPAPSSGNPPFRNLQLHLICFSFMANIILKKCDF